MKILAIDPGKKGGLALFQYNPTSSKLTLLEVIVTPCDKKTGEYKYRDIWEILIKYEPELVLLEEVQPRGTSGTISAKVMGVGEGMWLTMFSLLHIPHVKIDSQSWTAKLKLFYKPDKTLSKSANNKLLKKTHVDLAADLYPEFKTMFYGPQGGINDGPADATLIGTYWHQITNMEKSNV